jgi:hypothetical protein
MGRDEQARPAGARFPRRSEARVLTASVQRTRQTPADRPADRGPVAPPR